ncbi:MAG TPA: crotonase/enoyl-CoA hydratase family protein [Acidimicrobiales bacterium]|nr:crotonase/enoyl-CoA hydratase family protein [Acidimicrobiales bacterium]
MTYEHIALEVDGSVATITLNRPDKLNAFTTRMQHELVDAFDRTDADDDVRVVIVTGAGRAFCAGADLSSGSSAFDAGERAGGGEGSVPEDGGGEVTLRIWRSHKPVIAAINGPAVGVGITMTLPMDIRLASDAARMGFVFARRGIVPEACSSWFLPRIVGISRAAEWVYTGRVFDAAEALAGGLVRSVHPGESLLDEARLLAKEIAANTAPVSVALSRQMLWRGLVEDHPMEAHRADSRGIYDRGRSADVREGVSAFLEKRPAQFPEKVSDGLPDLFPGWREPEYE